MNHEVAAAHSGIGVAAGGHPAITESGLLTDSPKTVSRTPVDIRTVCTAVLASIAVVLFLRFAQEVFVPLAVGVLISYALEPIVAWLKRCGIPRTVGATVLLVALVGGAGVGVFRLLDDAVAVVEKLPAAARKLGESVKLTRGDEGPGLMQKMQDVATEMENTTTEAVGPDAIKKGVTRVQVEDKPINVGDYLWQGGSGIISVGSEVVLVLFLVYFILISGDLFTRKMMKIAGPSVLTRKITAQILDQIDTQIARYMLVQVMTSLIVGVVSGIGFWMMGLEQAPIWGIAVGLLDTIPYFGPAIAVAGLFTIGFLQFGTILMGLYLAGLAFLIMSLEGFVLTPWLTMRAVRMNGVALFLGLMFWGWMWGVWGLLLAVPMMVMIKSISDRVEDLKPVGELLGKLNDTKENAMIKRLLAFVLFAGVLALLGATPLAAFEQIDPGIFRVDWKTIDDLLTIGSQPDLNVLLLEDNNTTNISDAHMKLLRQWVESGGFLWVAGDGLKSPLAQAVAPFRSAPFDFVRSSSGNRGGELIVKGLSPRMTIADHALTAGVSRLYLFAQSKFDGSERADPLVQMGDSAGNSGWVLVAVPVGRGFMILDGTARQGPWLFRRLKGFDKDHPNSLRQDSVWNSYDWERLRANAQDHARQALAGGEGGMQTGF